MALFLRSVGHSGLASPHASNLLVWACGPCLQKFVERGALRAELLRVQQLSASVALK